ncbi:L-seryl-tRNA(Sec) selenium transferase [Enteractinococcus fodinae]|uniref:L-seryl-tRNA(Sec) selenium transferase n=1 Tax=Enteractinococcus fodinae TaxID=684663 RepID=A0ABU2AYD3_9MICC|nr:L-seryl-tRNA(Sec) selenium transferase [Enteractinococcus fodinae]MDR7346166.1 L-seryl-tRNA(Ser) seleniumtransferase [Enteractinococcus fodinae]
MSPDPRRTIPSTDRLLALDQVAAASKRLAPQMIRRIITTVQESARAGDIAPTEVTEQVIAAVEQASPTRLSSVLNATGVIIHTNLGRAPLSDAARDALITAAGYVDLELDLRDGKRSKRGTWAKAALLAAAPDAEDALVVNNGAAALSLATTALSVRADRPEVVISRGELVEIGAGFRLPDLITSTGVQLREVGATNRTNLDDYRDAITERTGGILKVHPSNYWIGGFNSDVETKQLAELAREHDVPLIVDVGSGLFERDPALPNEPTIGEALRAGADVVIASGDKLLGGPQAGLLLGTREVISGLATHPLARAFRADKFTLAALEATLNAPSTPVRDALHIDPDELHRRSVRIAEAVGAEVVAHDGRVGGGGGAGVPLPGWAISLDEALAKPLRTGSPAILPRVTDGRCLLDLRCVPVEADAVILQRLQELLEEDA